MYNNLIKHKKEYIAVIQAGGLGTRMREYTKDLIPKPLLKLNGKPMIQWQMESFARFGITEFIIITGHLGEKIEEWFGDGSKYGYSIKYIKESTPLGSAGSLFYIKDKLKDRDFVLAFGDVMFVINLERLLSFHENKGVCSTLVVHPNSHPYDSDLVIMDSNNIVTGIEKKGMPRETWYKNCVNSGLYVFKSEVLDDFSAPTKLDMEKDVISPLIKRGEVCGYATPEYIKDVGTPERFEIASEEQTKGVWERKCLLNKQICAFLDRDGTINKYMGLVSDDKDFELEQNAARAIKEINRLGILAIVITNQPVVARGLCSIEKVNEIHAKMETLLGAQGAYLDDILFCPHHPDKGYPEENPLYKIECNCRKPKTGMVDAMISKYNIDVNSSFFVGDTTVDIQTGINAGLQTVLLKTGVAGKDRKYDVKADYEAKDLLEAVNIIASESNIIGDKLNGLY